MSRALRRISRNREAKKALSDLVMLSNAIPALQGSLQGLTSALPKGSLDVKVQELLDALVEDCQTLARENQILRETFLRLLIMLGDDTEENLRKVEAELRLNVTKELEGT